MEVAWDGKKYFEKTAKKVWPIGGEFVPLQSLSGMSRARPPRELSEVKILQLYC